MDSLLRIITRSIIRNNGFIITYYRPEQLGDAWGIAWENFPRLDRFRNSEDYPKSGIPADLGALQNAVLVNAREDVLQPCAPIRLTDPGVDLLSNRQ